MASEREAQIEALLRQYREQLEQTLPEGPLDINQIEEVAERVSHEVQRELTERLVQEELERDEGNQTACACGGSARFRGRYAQEIVTAAGRLRVRRAYFYCVACGQGGCPADRRLGLGPANTTPTVRARLAVLSALVPYTQVNDVLGQLGLPLAVDLKSTGRIAQSVGVRLQAEPPASPFRTASGAVALALDGVMLPTWDGYKETRVGVIYEPDWETGRTPAAEAGLRKEYFATTGSRENLVRAACARAVERCGPSGLLAVLGDASALDWVDLRPYLAGKVAAWLEILDFYHVAERLALIARTMHPQDEAAAAVWRREMKQELLVWSPRRLLEGLRKWAPQEAGAQEVRREQWGYFAGQQEPGAHRAGGIQSTCAGVCLSGAGPSKGRVNTWSRTASKAEGCAGSCRPRSRCSTYGWRC